MKRQCGLLDFLVAAILGIVIVIGLLPQITNGHPDVRMTQCANNLSQLNKILGIYRVHNGGAYPEETGSDFWLLFERMERPLISERHREIYFCPVKGDEITPGRTDYRGPARFIRMCDQGDLIGADREDNHGEEGGNVLLKDGSVHRVFKGDTLWDACRKDLAP